MNRKKDSKHQLLTRNRVLRVVSTIPRGTVATYSWVARKAHTHPRAVGAILHSNTDQHAYPCHRVVDARGRLSQGYAFGGREGHKKSLTQEGIVVDDMYTVDQARYRLER